MHKPAGLIAIDLDGTLLNSQKELTAKSLHALERAAKEGFEIVPITGRFYRAMPKPVRDMPFVHYVVTINGALVTDLRSGRGLSRAEIPWQQAVEIMSWLDNYPLIYDCYQNNDAFMTVTQKEQIDETVASPHYRRMLHELRKPVPELKAFLTENKADVQKIQFFTAQPTLRLTLMKELPRCFEELYISSSVEDNVEINQIHANKGEALMALAKHLGLVQEQTFAIGDGLNDVPMLRAAGTGIAMANACPEARLASDYVTLSCDEDGVAHAVETLILNKEV